MRFGFLGRRSIKIAVTLVLLGVLAAVIEWEEFARLFRQVSWQLLVPLYVWLGSARIVEAFQLKVIIDSFKQATSLTNVFLANALATFYGFILPGDVFATIPKWLVLSKGKGSRSDILNAIVYNRIALLIPPVVLGCISLALLDPFESRWNTAVLLAAGCVIVAGTVLLLHPRSGRFLLNAIAYLAARAPPKLNGAVSAMIVSFAQIHKLTFRVHLANYSLSLSVALIRIFGFVFAAQIAQIDVPPLSLAFAYSLIVILALFPLTVGNIGIREGVLIYVLQMFGVSATQSILLGLILLSEQVAFAVIGGIYQVSLFRRSSFARRY
ncbi:MAG TPA: lysylphosphatidylglycerol synthase transmembrane domain-containing protein [Bryobacterales bacterium]|nr:lysylphosphatidylglycerol synthase transmembrane domain-containing protein [Bryobacterales bacterium]